MNLTKIALGTVLLAVAGLSASPAMAESETREELSLQELATQLLAPQQASDHFPAAVDGSRLGEVDGDSVRRLGFDGIAHYWIGVGRDERLCLISHIPGGMDVSGATCGTASEFARNGLSLAVFDHSAEASKGTAAYLLPAGTEVQPVISALGDSSLGLSAVAPDRLEGAQLIPASVHERPSASVVSTVSADGRTMTIPLHTWGD